MSNISLTPEQVTAYHDDGYVIVRNFFNADEATKLFNIAITDEAISNNSFDMGDNQGKRTKLSLWYTPGNDPYGMLSKSERMINAIKALADSSAPVCHFHSKLMQKEPKVGGAWEWHQDYGYWYKNGFLFAEQMISIMVALTEANIENGCLQVIRGSHKIGRVEHQFTGDQQGADMRYVDQALRQMELVYVELQPGDALFFHSNLLHRSEANNSDKPRWSFISCYNLQTNRPIFAETPASSYTVLEPVSDDAFATALDSGITLSVSASDFWTSDKDLAVKK